MWHKRGKIVGGSTAVSSVALSQLKSEPRLIAALSVCSLHGWHTEGEDYVGANVCAGLTVALQRIQRRVRWLVSQLYPLCLSSTHLAGISYEIAWESLGNIGWNWTEFLKYFKKVVPYSFPSIFGPETYSSSSLSFSRKPTPHHLHLSPPPIMPTTLPITTATLVLSRRPTRGGITVSTNRSRRRWWAWVQI